jgi:hypothetical protein
VPTRDESSAESFTSHSTPNSHVSHLLFTCSRPTAC